MAYKVVDIETVVRIIINEIFQNDISKAKVLIVIPSLFHNKKVYETLTKEKTVSNLDYDNLPIKKYWELDYEIKDDFNPGDDLKEYENFFIDFDSSCKDKKKCVIGQFRVYYKILEQS